MSDVIHEEKIDEQQSASGFLKFEVPDRASLSAGVVVAHAYLPRVLDVVRLSIAGALVVFGVPYTAVQMGSASQPVWLVAGAVLAQIGALIWLGRTSVR